MHEALPHPLSLNIENKDWFEFINSYFINGQKYKIDFNIINYEKDSKDIRQFAFVWSNTILRVYIKPMTVDIIPSVIASTSSIAAVFDIQLIYILWQRNDC